MELAQLTARHAELETNATAQRGASHWGTNALNNSTQRKPHWPRLPLRCAKIRYRLGEGSTETMLQLWQQRGALQGQTVAAALHVKRAFTTLERLLR